MEIDKQKALNTAVANAVASGARIESQSADQAIVTYVSHDVAKYVLLTVLSFGLYWLGGWLFYRPKKERREIIRIDDDGNTLVQKVR